jgi:hypothetical protein
MKGSTGRASAVDENPAAENIAPGCGELPSGSGSGGNGIDLLIKMEANAVEGGIVRHGIEVENVVLLIEQSLACMLTVDIYQELADLAKHRGRNRSAVYFCRGRARCAYISAHEESVIFLGRKAHFGKARGIRFRNIRKKRCHRRAFFSTSYKLFAGARAHYKPDGIDDDGFSRAGLTCKHGKSAREFHTFFFYNGYVFYTKLF